MKSNTSYKFRSKFAVITILIYSIFASVSAQQTGDDYYLLAVNAEDNGNLTEALGYYLQAADKYKSEWDTASAAWSYWSAGEVSFELDNYENSCNYFENAAEHFIYDKTPVNASIANSLAGYCKYKLKQYEAATGIFLIAIEQAESEEALNNAGFAYDGAGHSIKYTNWTKALEYWDNAQKNFKADGMSYTIPSDLEIEVETPANCKIQVGLFLDDKIDTLNKGQAVEISGQVLFRGVPTSPRRQHIKIEAIVPDCDISSDKRFVNLKTDANGKFSFRPFAGWNIGLYTIVASTDYILQDTGEKIYAKDSIYVMIKESNEANFVEQINEIIEHYYKAIPKGPLWTEKEALDRATSTFPSILFSTDRTKGWMHNILRFSEYHPYHKLDENGFYTCEGYQKTVMHFLDSIRFNSDPEIRKLMDGLDYGPIERGDGARNHLAVVIYPIGPDWMDDNSIVFDPWFTQKPDLYTMEEWLNFETLFSKWKPRVERKSEIGVGENLWAGFPIAGSNICPNVGNSNPYYAETLYYKPAYIFITSCPVNILIIDSKGNRIGITDDNSFVKEFSTNIHCFENKDTPDDILWFAELPDGKYQVQITGRKDGEFNFVLVNDTTQLEPFRYGQQPIKKGETATIQLGQNIARPILVLADGTEVEPESVPEAIEDDFSKVDNTLSIQTFPNPFNESTQISFHLNQNSIVKIDIFDLSGKSIITLMNEVISAGQHTVCWNGTDVTGTKMESGVYYCKISTTDYSACIKLLLLH